MRKTTLLGAPAATIVASLALSGVAAGQSGGLSGGGESRATDSNYYPHWFGARDLKVGMRGEDVRTLNWALRGMALNAPYHGDFQRETDGAVRSFQAGAGIPSDGVVRRDTRKAIASRMLTQKATWYGPGFYGKRTACGKKLKPTTVGVAHRKLRCGTRVLFANAGRWVRAKVIDRGPYRTGYKWDLTRKLAKRLGVLQVGSASLKATVAP